MIWYRRRAPWAARWVTAGPCLAALVAVAAIGAADVARGQDPPPAEPLPACSNLEDDDGDELADLDDPDCSEPTDAHESPSPPPQPPSPPTPAPPPPSPSVPIPQPTAPSLPGGGTVTETSGIGESANSDGMTGQGAYGGRRRGTGGGEAGARAGGERGGRAATARGGGTGPGDQGGSGAHGGRRAAGGERGSGGTAAAERRRRPAPEQPAHPDGAPKSHQTSRVAAFGASSLLSDRFPIPPFLLPIYRECGSRYGLRWQVLAAINEVETGFGANLNVSTAGAVGWMQFLPSTWRAYGVDADGDGRRNPYDPHDAICAAARYLRAAGAPGDIHAALFTYNHAEWYVDLVLGLTRQYESLYLPEPLPWAKRLDRDFARKLAWIAREREADWALVLAILRVRGGTARTSASAAEVRAVAARIARAQRRDRDATLGALARSLFAKRPTELRVAATTRYNRVVGLQGLVAGLHAVEDRLRRRVLESDRLSLYPGGRDDIDANRIDPRVLTLLLYLAEKYDGVTITSLVSGHGYFARPGVPSMHVFGRAVDIAAIRGTPILGHQQPGGVTEDALRDILLLPDELQPAQVISLIDLGGPSFAASDHHDHIHIGF